MTAADLLDHILNELGEVRTRCPELRFGQLIAIIGELAQDETGHSLWDVEDTDFAAALERFARDIAQRESGQAESFDAPDRGIASSPSSAPPQPPQQIS